MCTKMPVMDTSRISNYMIWKLVHEYNNMYKTIITVYLSVENDNVNCIKYQKIF